MNIPCFICGKLVYRKPSKVSGKSYCSGDCMAKDYKIRMKGLCNPNFRNAGQKECKYCKEYFINFNKKSKYCSHKCYRSDCIKLLKKPVAILFEICDSCNILRPFRKKHKAKTCFICRMQKLHQSNGGCLKPKNKVITAYISKTNKPIFYEKSNIYIKNCKRCGTKTVFNTNTKTTCPPCVVKSRAETAIKTGVAQRQNMFKNCVSCKSEFRVSKSIEEKKYCSKKCYATEQWKGSNNPNYIDGRTKESSRIRGSKEYKAWRKAVFVRDNFTCVFCGKKSSELKSGTIHADHIKPFAYHPELRLDVSNGRTLCLACHKGTDTYLKGYKKRVKT
jgi:hypothetical protein